MAKNKKPIETEILIENIEFPNFGIGYHEDKTVKIKNCIPGQKLNVRVYRKRRKFEGTVLEKISPASYEIKPKCEDFLVCGGCTFQNISYEDELRLKKQMVTNIFENDKITLPEDFTVQNSPCIEGYRNKMEYSFGDDGIDGNLSLGMRKMNSFYEVVTSKDCNIVDKDYQKIVNGTLNYFKSKGTKFYHKKTQQGTLRHLVVRKGHFTNEIFINLVTANKTDSSFHIGDWIDVLLNLELESKIVGITHSVNYSVGDVVQADEFYVLYGYDFFTDKLFDLKFKISAFSFFQTNSAGAEKLYSIVKDFPGNIQDKTIFDLYCGTGTIAQVLSRNAKKVIGVEIVEEAIIKARENAKLNNIENCEFIVGDVLKVVEEIDEKPEIIVVDPPRNGIHQKALEKIIAFGAEKIIYISCKPTSLTRDLKILFEHGYKMEKITSLDMFPRTYHVETVALLSR